MGDGGKRDLEKEQDRVKLSEYIDMKQNKNIIIIQFNPVFCLPVHTPVAFSSTSSLLTHVFPESGKLARATAALLVPLMN